MAKKKESLKYEEMLQKVEEIVEQVSEGEMDLDSIVEKVEEGYTHIKTMRARLDETRNKIEKLREDFEDEE